MGLFNNFPYTNFHELNLDWLLKKMKELEAAWYSWKAVNQIVFADPVDWSTSNTYAQHVIVIHNGIGYLSRKPVPAGVNITDEEYWEQITNFGDAYSRQKHLMSFQGKLDTSGSDSDFVDTLQMNDLAVPIRDTDTNKLASAAYTTANYASGLANSLNDDMIVVKHGIAIFAGEKTVDEVQKAIDDLPAHATLILPCGTYENPKNDGLYISKPFHLQGATTGYNGDGVVTFTGSILVQNTSGVQLSNLAVKGFSNASAFYFGSSSNCYIEHCIAYNDAPDAANTTGFRCTTDSHDLTFVDCRAENIYAGFTVSGTSNNPNSEIMLMHCTVNNCTEGVNAENVNGCSFIDTTISNCRTVGATIAHSMTSFMGCTFDGINLWALNMTGGATFVSACIFNKCNQSNTDNCGCIYNKDAEALITGSIVMDHTEGVHRALMYVDGGGGTSIGNIYEYSMWGSSEKGLGLKNWNSANVLGSGSGRFYGSLTDPSTLS